MLYESPSVDRPNRLTTRWPRRCPSPHFTTARATRKAMMMRRIVELANPAYAWAGVSSRQHGRRPRRTRTPSESETRRRPRTRWSRRRSRTAATRQRSALQATGTNQIATRQRDSAASRAIHGGRSSGDAVTARSRPRSHAAASMSLRVIRCWSHGHPLRTAAVPSSRPGS